MGISGIYAVTEQLTNGQIITGGIDIDLQVFKINNENKEVKYIEDNKVVMPGEVVSFIPKVENKGERCYLRAKIFYINESIDINQFINGISSDWVKHGEYYYYGKTFDSGKTTKLFDSVQIPNNINEITNSKKIKLEITVEAVQEKNFTPDYTKDDPWQGIVPTKSIRDKYDIDTTTNSKMTIKYENGASEDIIVSDDFFDNMKTIMPGDSYDSSIEIKNKDKKVAKYYLRFKYDEIALLKETILVITNKKGQIIYNGKIKDAKNIFLGEYKKNQGEKLDLKILVPEDMENQYENLSTKLEWIFKVEYDKEIDKKNNNKTNPQTGDNINVAITMFILSSIGLIVVMVLEHRERKNIE